MKQKTVSCCAVRWCGRVTRFAGMGTPVLAVLFFACTESPTSDDGEKDDSATCESLVTGTVTVVDDSDLADLADVCAIEGDLVIGETSLTTIDLNSLVSVSGRIVLQQNLELTEIGLLNLKTAGSLLIDANDSLTELDLPALAVADLTLNANAALSTVNLSSFISGSVGVSSCDSLTTMNLPSLSSAAALTIMHNDALSTLRAPLLQTIERELIVNKNPGLIELELPLLKSAPWIGVDYNDALPSLEFAEMETVTDWLQVTHNSVLTHIRAPQLKSLGGTLIEENPLLSECSGEPLEDAGDCAL